MKPMKFPMPVRNKSSVVYINLTPNKGREPFTINLRSTTRTHAGVAACSMIPAMVSSAQPSKRLLM